MGSAASVMPVPTCFDAHLMNLVGCFFCRQSSDVPSAWTENGSLASKSSGSVEKHTDWHSIPQESEDAVTPSKPPTSEPLKDGILAMNEPVVENMNSSLDDEMVSWLQYPLDDSLEKSYCSDFFGDLPNSTGNQVQDIRVACRSVGQTPVSRNNQRGMPPPGNVGMNGNQNRPVSADAAMAMGAGRAAGVLPQAGVEAFQLVRTQQTYSGKWSPPISSSSRTKTTPGPSSPTYGQRTPTPVINNIATSLYPPAKAYPVPLQPATARRGPMNFPHFAVPAVTAKANLHQMGVSHNLPVQNRMKTPQTQVPAIQNAGSRPFETCTSSGSSMAESNTTRLHSEGSRIETQMEGVEGHQPAVLANESNWATSIREPIQPSNKVGQEPPMSDSTMAGASSQGTIGNNDVDTDSRPADVENRQNCTSSVGTSNTSQGTDKPKVPELPELPEPTITSSSGGSGNSGKAGVNRGKRRTREPEESEAQSDVSYFMPSLSGKILVIFLCPSTFLIPVMAFMGKERLLIMAWMIFRMPRKRLLRRSRNQGPAPLRGRGLPKCTTCLSG
jgi:phytochrome-interacting factor 3